MASAPALVYNHMHFAKHFSDSAFCEMRMTF
ncbi:hypothetical protein EDD55_1057 [Varunaivibrio sulfuroxidans]|uniref:Uncharacterized protein n=1 Tax=Varunaivibrio sulfuroxidans TaxID=1773489 RepID=A0A4R3JA33_9PROT|nr:hypothetical protein EDD55_1057 [Varunaivibrio sulfuroxidans]